MKKLTLTCTVTGKQTTYTSEEYIAKRIEKAGSLENLIATYVCRDAGKAHKKVAKPIVKQEDKTFNGKKILDSTPKEHRGYQYNWKNKVAQIENGVWHYYTDGVLTGTSKDTKIGSANRDDKDNN